MGQLLSESDAQLAEWKTKILAAVGETGQVIDGGDSGTRTNYRQTTASLQNSLALPLKIASIYYFKNSSSLHHKRTSLSDVSG